MSRFANENEHEKQKHKHYQRMKLIKSEITQNGLPLEITLNSEWAKEREIYLFIVRIAIHFQRHFDSFLIGIIFFSLALSSISMWNKIKRSLLLVWLISLGCFGWFFNSLIYRIQRISIGIMVFQARWIKMKTCERITKSKQKTDWFDVTFSMASKL